MNMENNNTPKEQIPGTLALFKSIENNRNKELERAPKVFDWDWNEVNVIENNFETFFSIAHCNYIYPKQEITKRIESSKILRNSMKWNISKELINEELIRLVKIYPELEYDSFFLTIINYLLHQIRLSIIIAVDHYSSNDYNNKLFKTIDNLYRNRKRSPDTIEKNTETANKISKTFIEIAHHKTYIESVDSVRTLLKGEEDSFEFFNQNFLHLLATIHENKYGHLEGMKTLKGIMKGTSSIYMRLLPTNSLRKNGKDELYRNLYPLFKILIKDPKLISFEEYDTKHWIRYKNYDHYKISKVKIILGKTK
ncbi:MAG: hypothetical protein A3F72_12875 [Bacteroidetes bacterium RIFCSPLOWO2_12_FULL_35_15]|nr:MAG: hypothetical protein A3F72_12875 [Bacteroidetes bacterium RIFCSPLOWO2_12_FULL_35_15]